MSLWRISLIVGPLHLVSSEHGHTVPLGLGRRIKLLHHSTIHPLLWVLLFLLLVIFLIPSGRVLVVHRLYILKMLDRVLCHLLPAMRMCLWSSYSLKRICEFLLYWLCKFCISFNVCLFVRPCNDMFYFEVYFSFCFVILNFWTKVPKVLNNRKIFLLVASFHCLQVSFFRSKGKCSYLWFYLENYYPL